MLKKKHNYNMEEESKKEESSKLTPVTGLSQTAYVIIAVALVGGGILGYFFGSSGSWKKNSNPIPQQVVNKYEPITNNGLLSDPTKILLNPIFTEWTGSVEGTVTAKDDKSFTLSNKESNLVIYLQKSLTGFYGKPVGKGAPPKITLAEIPIGTRLRGGVTISRISLTSDPSQHVFGDVFSVVDNEPTKAQ